VGTGSELGALPIPQGYRAAVWYLRYLTEKENSTETHLPVEYVVLECVKQIPWTELPTVTATLSPTIAGALIEHYVNAVVTPDEGQRLLAVLVTLPQIVRARALLSTIENNMPLPVATKTQLVTVLMNQPSIVRNWEKDIFEWVCNEKFTPAELVTQLTSVPNEIVKRITLNHTRNEWGLEHWAALCSRKQIPLPYALPYMNPVLWEEMLTVHPNETTITIRNELTQLGLSSNEYFYTTPKSPESRDHWQGFWKNYPPVLLKTFLMATLTAPNVGGTATGDESALISGVFSLPKSLQTAAVNELVTHAEKHSSNVEGSRIAGYVWLWGNYYGNVLPNTVRGRVVKLFTVPSPHENTEHALYDYLLSPSTLTPPEILTVVASKSPQIHKRAVTHPNWNPATPAPALRTEPAFVTKNVTAVLTHGTLPAGWDKLPFAEQTITLLNLSDDDLYAVLPQLPGGTQVIIAAAEPTLCVTHHDPAVRVAAAKTVPVEMLLTTLADDPDETVQNAVNARLGAK
jgi:hypothetical protein